MSNQFNILIIINQKSAKFLGKISLKLKNQGKSLIMVINEINEYYFQDFEPEFRVYTPLLSRFLIYFFAVEPDFRISVVAFSYFNKKFVHPCLELHISSEDGGSAFC